MPTKKKSAAKPQPGFVMPKEGLDLSEMRKRKPTAGESAEEALVKEIRDDFGHFKSYWKENRDDMEIDMRFAAADAFSAEEHRFREGLSRPCETPDELSQYVKQTNNNLRQNKRDCKISPSSADADGADAEKREDVLRGLNHRGNFQAAFQTAFECCVWSGMGAFGISLRKGKDGHIEPTPRRIPNQFSFLLDPYCKQADYSDQKKFFLVDVIRKSDFAREYPKARQKSFSADDAKMAPDWVLGDEIVTAEAWRVAGELDVAYDSKTKEGEVIQYITNGLEILDKIKHPGSWIPFMPILGEEIYVTEGGRQKRKYLSLIRRARTAQKMLAFLASQEIEEFGQAPRTKYIGYDGQFTSPDWQTLNTDPKAWISVPAIADPLDPNKVLPLPTLVQFNPHASEYQISGEVWRRRVQSAIGVMPLPSSAQRQNEKSGVALEKIQTQEAIGSYHFTDNADRALVNYGRQMNELIVKGMSHDRHVGTKKKDDSDGLIYLTTSGKQAPAGVDDKAVLYADKGEFDVTLTTGPNQESQRDAASEFVDTLIANLKALPIPPPVATKILAIAIRLKNVGAKGDAIADLLDPKEGDPAAAAQKAMGELQQQQQAMQELQQELQQLRLEKQGKVIDNQFKIQLEQIRAASDEKMNQLTNDIKVLTALITAKRGQADQEAEMYKTFWVENHQAGRDAAAQAADHTHERGMADQQQQAAAAMAAAQPGADGSQPQGAGPQEQATT
jgi:hypothetical protein